MTTPDRWHANEDIFDTEPCADTSCQQQHYGLKVRIGEPLALTSAGVIYRHEVEGVLR